MARFFASSAQPEWVTIQPAGGPPISLDPTLASQAFNNGGGTVNLFEFADIGHRYSAIRFVIRLDSGSPTFTPEASYFPSGPAESGLRAPQPFTVPVGNCYGDPYGVDEMRPFWRLKITGAGAGAWGVEGIPR